MHNESMDWSTVVTTLAVMSIITFLLGVALFRRCSLDELHVRSPAGTLRVARLGDRVQP